MTGGSISIGEGTKDLPAEEARTASTGISPSPGTSATDKKKVGKEIGPRRYYVNRSELWTLRQRVNHGLNLIIVGMAVSLLANGFIFLTPMSLWSIYLAQVMTFLGSIVVFFGVLSIYFRLKE